MQRDTCACVVRTGKCWPVGNTGSLAVNLYRDRCSLLKADAELGENHITQNRLQCPLHPVSFAPDTGQIHMGRSAFRHGAVKRRGEERT